MKRSGCRGDLDDRFFYCRWATFCLAFEFGIETICDCILETTRGSKYYQQKLLRCWSLWLLNFLQNSPISKIILWSGIYLQSITKMNRLGCCCKIESLTFKYFASNFRICQEISTSNAKRNDMTEIMKIIRILFLFWKCFIFDISKCVFYGHIGAHM